MKKQTIILSFLFMVLGLADASAQSALEIFQECRSAFVIRGATVIDFDWEMYNRKSELEQNIKGTLHFQSSSFRIEYPGVIAAYSDGVFSFFDKEDGTLTYNRPSEEERQQINLLTFLLSSENEFNITKAGESKVGPIIKLTPKNKGKIKEIELTVNRDSMLPHEVLVRTDDMNSIIMKVLRIKHRGGFPNDHYRLESKDFPRAEIIDLR